MNDPDLLSRPSLAPTRSRNKVSLLEDEARLTPARKTHPTRYKPDGACLAACRAEAARRTEVGHILKYYTNVSLIFLSPFPVSPPVATTNLPGGGGSGHFIHAIYDGSTAVRSKLFLLYHRSMAMGFDAQ